ncbi:MAG: hypothetical protein R2805_07725 [Flavobacterium sp.]|jgi:hypothetical protein|uniref:hypothetical protein n=1 Tax=Flavobacterium sp. TaxID=239 RepID=UPI002C9B9231|nr:hypothetical protein [Flavobacterium sp.]MCA0347725.1 hypothetical protein [Bacteroidota bacterium]HQA74785.1 hypothetical protein [Flavobacterium sp.]
MNTILKKRIVLPHSVLNTSSKVKVFVSHKITFDLDVLSNQKFLATLGVFMVF